MRSVPAATYMLALLYFVDFFISYKFMSDSWNLFPYLFFLILDAYNS